MHVSFVPFGSSCCVSTQSSSICSARRREGGEAAGKGLAEWVGRGGARRGGVTEASRRGRLQEAKLVEGQHRRQPDSHVRLDDAFGGRGGGGVGRRGRQRLASSLDSAAPGCTGHGEPGKSTPPKPRGMSMKRGSQASPESLQSGRHGRKNGRDRRPRRVPGARKGSPWRWRRRWTQAV